MSSRPWVTDSPIKPKKPLSIRPRPASTSPIGPTIEPADRRSTPPGISTMADDCSMNSIAVRIPLVITTRLRRSSNSNAR